MILLDTNLLSEMLRKEPLPPVTVWIESHNAKLAIPAIAIAELSFGIERIRPSERSRQLEAAFDEICKRFARQIIPFDAQSALVYGKIAGALQRRGRMMSMPDAMIAATALRHRSALATRNTKHFVGLGIELFNPWNA